MDCSKILDSWQLLQLANGKYPETVTEINGEGLGFTDVVSDDFKYFQNIEYIELSDNNILISDILVFPKLHDLYLNCNGIREISDLSRRSTENKLFPKELTHLSLAYNELSIPSIINLCNAFHSLISLNLSNNALNAIPSQIVHLQHLSNFNLSCNKLQGLSVWNILANIPALTELDLSDNQFSAIPEITEFQTIYHRTDSLLHHQSTASSVPMGPRFFPKLEYLNLKSNRIDHSADILCIQHYPRITMLDIRDNAFLNEIWISIKNRKIAAECSQQERYENVFIPKNSSSASIQNSSAQLPRPCDFGRIYWEIVLSRGIVCVVDDPSHENVFELQPILTNSNQTTTTTLTKEDSTISQRHSDTVSSIKETVTELEDDGLDTNVFSLLQTQISGDSKPNMSVSHCIQKMNQILNK